ncbi:VOC family protein [Lactococcus garvieae]|uniref:VOC family protein n=2 Tax=Lactococcus garvieae TaxID=1363 RepID=A0AAX3N902_9LACT|nr:VOC family protein [Lactococcus garvieae]WEA12967.1 VOC family protein [Lactococcus garvieae]
MLENYARDDIIKLRFTTVNINLREIIMTKLNSEVALGGIHHVTAITSSAQKTYDFFTNILGLRLAKLTVNQDDYETYHLYFTDEEGNPGTDMTFFDFPGIGAGSHGINSIDRISFRVAQDISLEYWHQRFDAAAVPHGLVAERFGKKYLEFEDFDGQRYQLISDEKNQGVLAPGKPWQLSNVEAEHAILGLGPVFIKLSEVNIIQQLLAEVFGFRRHATEDNFTLFEGAGGGNGASIIIEQDKEGQHAYQGHGTVHHVAFRTANPDTLRYWIERVKSYMIPHSGLVERFYFSSEYVKVAPGVLFEIATDTPGIAALDMVRSGQAKVDSYEEALVTSGFWIDETPDEAGLSLSLPPHLFPGAEAEKARTAAALRRLDTSDAFRDRKLEPLWTMKKIQERRIGRKNESI